MHAMNRVFYYSLFFIFINYISIISFISIGYAEDGSADEQKIRSILANVRDNYNSSEYFKYQNDLLKNKELLKNLIEKDDTMELSINCISELGSNGQEFVGNLKSIFEHNDSMKETVMIALAKIGFCTVSDALKLCEDRTQKGNSRLLVKYASNLRDQSKKMIDRDFNILSDKEENRSSKAADELKFHAKSLISASDSIKIDLENKFPIDSTLEILISGTDSSMSFINKTIELIREKSLGSHIGVQLLESAIDAGQSWFNLQLVLLEKAKNHKTDVVLKVLLNVILNGFSLEVDDPVIRQMIESDDQKELLNQLGKCLARLKSLNYTSARFLKDRLIDKDQVLKNSDDITSGYIVEALASIPDSTTEGMINLRNFMSSDSAYEYLKVPGNTVQIRERLMSKVYEMIKQTIPFLKGVDMKTLLSRASYFKNAILKSIRKSLIPIFGEKVSEEFAKEIVDEILDTNSKNLSSFVIKLHEKNVDRRNGFQILIENTIDHYISEYQSIPDFLLNYAISQDYRVSIRTKAAEGLYLTLHDRLSAIHNSSQADQDVKKNIKIDNLDRLINDIYFNHRDKKVDGKILDYFGYSLVVLQPTLKDDKKEYVYRLSTEFFSSKNKNMLPESVEADILRNTMDEVYFSFLLNILHQGFNNGEIDVRHLMKIIARSIQDFKHEMSIKHVDLLYDLKKDIKSRYQTPLSPDVATLSNYIDGMVSSTATEHAISNNSILLYIFIVFCAAILVIILYRFLPQRSMNLVFIFYNSFRISENPK